MNYKILFNKKIMAVLFIVTVIAVFIGTIWKYKQIQTEQAELKKWFEIYKDPYVLHIRKALNGYLDGTNVGMSDPELVIESLKDDTEHKTGLSSFNKDYYKSKFIVFSNAPSAFGGREINIIFQDKPNKIFWTLVYKPVEMDYDLRGFAQSSKFTQKFIDNFVQDNKEFLEDKEHAL